MATLLKELAVEDSKRVPPSNLKEYAGKIDKLANDLDQSGWRIEANYLRKWSLELREKAVMAVDSQPA